MWLSALPFQAWLTLKRTVSITMGELQCSIRTESFRTVLNKPLGPPTKKKQKQRRGLGDKCKKTEHSICLYEGWAGYNYSFKNHRNGCQSDLSFPMPVAVL
ncbi:hypothetical protein ILYODFUR_028449 [Ilyodon furcidens]|uniref:Secreted protein n=1 Tax=Ilyodon furcidens TaxID=33524 RepID=A0ABV0SQ00_9TELE